MPEVLASFNSLGGSGDGGEDDEGGEYSGGGFERSIGPKVDHAALLRTVVGGGCPLAVHKVDGEG